MLVRGKCCSTMGIWGIASRVKGGKGSELPVAKHRKWLKGREKNDDDDLLKRDKKRRIVKKIDKAPYCRCS